MLCPPSTPLCSINLTKLVKSVYICIDFSRVIYFVASVRKHDSYCIHKTFILTKPTRLSALFLQCLLDVLSRVTLILWERSHLGQTGYNEAALINIFMNKGVNYYVWCEMQKNGTHQSQHFL